MTMMKPLKELIDVVTLLPRGGYLVDSQAGYIQFGAPPETIKDTILLPKGVPLVYVLPHKFFNWIKGISVAELEFPIYYNYFIKKRKTRIVCNAEQAEKIKIVILESLFGPQGENRSDYSPESGSYYSNIEREMDFFRIMKFEDVVEFCLFENDSCKIDDVIIRFDLNNNFEVLFENELLAIIPGIIEYKPKYLVGERLSEPFIPPLFGMTCLGPSSGFDPYENTSGFIMWLNHNGVMIDPPVNSTEWLLDSNVSPKVIDSIILTHCHADHDAGTFQKILEEEKITIYTTKPIMMSFLKKYSALTDVSEEYLMQLFVFHPIDIETPLFINGARFDVNYALHSIPTIGFRVKFQNKSLVYSSDHNNDPAIHKMLFDKGIIDKKRYNLLNNFPWQSDIIFHESGLTPLHTPVEILTALPEEIQKKIYIYHTPKSEIPPGSLLNVSKFGIDNTLTFDVDPPAFETTYQILSLLNHIDLLKGITIAKAMEFISIVEQKHFKKGDIIIKKGTPGDTFFIIYSGTVSIVSENKKFQKHFGMYDYFGEAAILKEENRSTDVVAETDVVLYSIEKDKFKDFVAGTNYITSLQKLVNIRDDETWSILSSSRFLKFFTPTQRALFESLLVPVEISGKGVLLKEGEIIKDLFLIREGTVIVSRNNENEAILQAGDLAGQAANLYEGKVSDYTFYYNGSVQVYSINCDEFKAFLNHNPGLIMKLDYVFEQYLFFNG
jgi:CRP-like cAMP-binding protein